MFCSSCGTEQPDDSKFCRKCGIGLLASSKKKSKSYASTIIIVILALTLLASLIPLLTRTIQSPGPLLQQIVAQPHTVRLGGEAFTVNNLGYVYTKFTVPDGATNVSVTGHFTASGGIGNDIEAYIFTADGFANFQNDHEAATCYQSGRVTQDTLNVRLPAGATYYLVFNNKFSLLSAKAIQSSITLNYLD